MSMIHGIQFVLCCSSMSMLITPHALMFLKKKVQKNVHDNLISMEVKNEVAWTIVSSVITLYSGK
jgi:hypothetical protein